MNIFSDRDYINHTNDKRLEGLTLIQIPRHYIKNIKLDVFDDIIIYRILCEKNNNKIYQNWEKLDFTLAIIGDQCIHTEIVRKKFKKGVVKMKAGGPKSSDPIFIDNLSRTEQKFKIL